MPKIESKVEMCSFSDHSMHLPALLLIVLFLESVLACDLTKPLVYSNAITGTGYHRKVEYLVRCVGAQSVTTCPMGTFRLLLLPTKNYFIDLDEAANEGEFTNVTVTSSSLVQVSDKLIN